MPVLETFYTRVRPFGFWTPVRAHCAAASQIASLPMTAINVVAGVFALIASLLSVFFLIGHYFSYFGTAFGVVLLCGIILYCCWYRTLPTTCVE
jgi:hypothetical protein